MLNALFAAQEEARVVSNGDTDRLGERLAALDRLVTTLRDDGSLEGTTEALADQLGDDPVLNKLLIRLAVNAAMISALRRDVLVPNQL